MNLNLSTLFFDVGNAAVMPFWILMIFFPRIATTAKILNYEKFTPIHFIAVLYTVTVIPAILSTPSLLTTLSKPTIEAIQKLLGSPEGIAAGWLHYLCFDLFVGISVWKKAIAEKQSFKWVSPVLIFVLMLGPFGWLLYAAGSQLFSSRRAIAPQ